VDSCVGGWLQGEPRNSDSVIPKVPLTPHFKGTPPRVLSHNFVQGFDAQLYASFLRIIGRKVLIQIMRESWFETPLKRGHPSKI
jgi:hypothetical protein